VDPTRRTSGSLILAVLVLVAAPATVAADAAPTGAFPSDAAPPDTAPPEAAPPEIAAGDLVREADAAFAREDFKRARALYEEAVRRAPDAVHPLRRLALLQSWDGETEMAIANYRRALALEPANPDLALDLAKTLSSNKEFGEAIRIYEGLRAARPDDSRVLLGLGQALSLKGRFADAEVVYRDMVERKIEPLQAHLGRARILAWQGRLELAESYYRDVLRADPGNVEARLGIARAHHGQGLDRTALAQIDNLVLDHPSNREALALQKTIHEALRPRGAIDASRSDDSEDNRIDGTTAACTFMAEPQTAVRIALSTYRAELGPLETRAGVLTAGLTSRLLRPLTFQARLGAVRQEDFGGGSRVVAVGGGFIRWQVGPRLALVGSGSREAMLDTAPLIDRGLRIDQAEARLEYRFRPAWILAGSAGYAIYSDDNARLAAGVSLQARLPRAHPRVAATLDARYRAFDEDLDSGYFDPLRYDSELLTVAVWDDYRDGRLYWRIEGTYGRQDFETAAGSAAPAGAGDRVMAVQASLGAGLGSRATLEAYYSRGDHALQLATGSEARSSGFSLRYRF
jgi:pentatricopeptide repeat protein